MMLFLLFGVPVYIWFINELYFSPYDRIARVRDFLWGFVVCILLLPIRSAVGKAWGLPYEGWSLFLSGLFIDLLLPGLYLALAYGIVYRKDIFKLVSGQVERFLAFFSGASVPLSIQTSVTFRGWEEGLVYLLLPFIWIHLGILVALMCSVWFSSSRKERYVVLIGGSGWICLLGWFEYLYRINYRLVSGFLILCGFLGITLLFPRLMNRIRYL
jgi:hypothetical protein